jgi:DNA modification methylase
MNILNTIINKDVLDGLKDISDETVALTVTSPPYNLKIDYDSIEDDQPYADYLVWLKEVFSEVYRVTKHGGRCAINIDAMTNRQDDKDQEYVRCIYAHLYNLMKEIGWKFRTEICWYKQNAVGKQTAWGSWVSCSNPTIRRTHEYILVFSKGDWKLEGDSELSDMTKDEFCEYTLSTWFISPETRKMAGHPATYPEELVKRLVKLFSYRDDVVLDPFNGSGTTTYVATKFARQYIGIDVSEDYCQYARERIETVVDLFDNEYIPRSKRLGKKKKVEKEKEEDLFNGI